MGVTIVNSQLSIDNCHFSTTLSPLHPCTLSPLHMTIPGDILAQAVSNPLVAALITPGSEITIRGWA